MEKLPQSHFTLSYDEVIIKAQSIQPHFTADLQQFAVHDPWFNSAVNTELLSSIYIGLKDFEEGSLTVKIKQLTGLLELKLSAARHCYEKLNYFVDSGFEDPAVSNETFGYEDFTIARDSVKNMILLLNKAHAAILNDENQTKLLAAGMPPGLPLELTNIVAEMSAGHGALKIFKKQHLLVSRERIELFNTIWDVLVKICEQAKIIFANDPTRLTIYELYDTQDTDPEQVEALEKT